MTAMIYQDKLKITDGPGERDPHSVCRMGVIIPVDRYHRTLYIVTIRKDFTALPAQFCFFPYARVNIGTAL
jgi:hypothetical protein